MCLTDPSRCRSDEPWRGSSRSLEEQITFALRPAEARLTVEDIGRKLGVSRRRICQTSRFPRASLYYRSRNDPHMARGYSVKTGREVQLPSGYRSDVGEGGRSRLRVM